MTKSETSDWLKGGLRYAKLKDIVPEYLAPEPVEAFFVAVGGRGRWPRLLNPLSPFQREYVVAVTAKKVFVLRLKRPAVFRASIDKIVSETRREAAAKWDNGRVVLGETSYWPISFHSEDAEELVSLTQD